MMTSTEHAEPVRRGWHFGTAASSGRSGRFLLTETRYAAGLRTPLHAHEAPAFCLVLGGRYVQRFGRREVVYRPSVVLFRPARAEHTDHISARGATCFIIEPDPAWLDAAGLHRLNRDLTLDCAGPRARWLASHALREFRDPDGSSPLALEGLVLALGAEFSRIPEAHTRERRVPPWLVRTRESLDADVATRATLSELAADAGVHPVYLATAFRCAFGTSVGQYVRARRVDAARLALRDPARSINEIALGLGFSSQSHFTRVFREHAGLTPFAYRRLHARA